MSEALQIRFLTVEEAAKELGKSDRWVSKLCKDGRLGQRFGGKVWMITEPELQEFLKIPRPRGACKGEEVSSEEGSPSRRELEHDWGMYKAAKRRAGADSERAGKAHWRSISPT